MTELIAATVLETAAKHQLSQDDILRLVQTARDVSLRAYAPYSNYRVGAALLTNDGTIIGGCNVENASFSLTICAERSALCSAVALGHREFRAVAVATADGGSPCGACRQFMFEFNPAMLVIIGSQTEIVAIYTAEELLPHGFKLTGSNP